MLDTATLPKTRTSPPVSSARPGGGRLMGIIPRSRLSRSLAAFGLLNFVLAMLPVWNAIGNAPALVWGLLPLTVLWSYAAFTLNFILAIVVYFAQFRPWARSVESELQ